MELDDHLHVEVMEFLNKGKEFAYQKYYEKSIELFSKGLVLIPEPKIEYEVNTWLHIEMADSYYNLKNYEIALLHYNFAYNSEEGVDDACLWFNLGRTYFCLDNLELAKICLKQSYILEGDEYFANQDQKYFLLIKQDVIVLDK